MRAHLVAGLVTGALVGAAVLGARLATGVLPPSVRVRLAHEALPPPPSPKLPTASDRVWWQNALGVRHWPGPEGYGLALDTPHQASVVVFVYHQVAPSGWPLRNGPDYITPARLATEFVFFHAHHVTTLTPAQFIAFLDGKARVPTGSVFLTFDNGLEGVYRYAYPLARRYHVHFTVFLIGDRVRDVWRAGDKTLAWSQVVQMHASGLVGVESETYDLHATELIADGRYGPALERQWEPTGRYESLAAYVGRLHRAFALQREAFWRHLHTTPILLVWPFSTYNRVAEMEARAAGYQAAFAVYPGVVTASAGLDRFALPRDPATFMWDNVPVEYELLRAGGLRLTWPPSTALNFLTAADRPRASSAASGSA